MSETDQRESESLSANPSETLGANPSESLSANLSESEDENPIKKTTRKPFVMTEARAATLKKGRDKRLENCKAIRENKKQQKKTIPTVKPISSYEVVPSVRPYNITFV